MIPSYISVTILPFFGLFSEAFNFIPPTTTATIRQGGISFALHSQFKSDGDTNYKTEEPSIDGYHLTTKTNKELIFDAETGRFFETSIRPGSFHQLWQEYLQQDTNNNNDDGGDYSTIRDKTTTTNFSNDMVPTESLFPTSGFNNGKNNQEFTEAGYDECLVHTPYQDTCESTPLNSLEDQDEYDEEKENVINSNAANDKKKLKPKRTSETMVEKCYAAWNRRNMKEAANCFADFFEYQDGQYLGKMTNKKSLIDHFEQQAHLLPPNSRIVVDEIADDTANTGNIATMWHLERADGSTVPYTKGCSFYTTTPKDGLIKTGFRVSEMILKPNKSSVNTLLSMIPTSSSDNSNISSTTTTTTPANVVEKNDPNDEHKDPSIIEQYFEAWNRRDMEAALDCFEDDCIYETEDPVFVDKFVGKAALREHLMKNANVLPSSCIIVLDKIAVDKMNGTIGTRWHLEVNGIPIPNLRGCSMYTTDIGTGRLKTGFDVTEAPTKLPREVTSFLWLPAVAIFDLL